ncbi:MAG: PEGA domain-containing protein [Bdellovibrionota bacterium]
MRYQRKLNLIAILAIVLVVAACGGSRKILVVKSEPADAEVCIKGKGGSEYFSNSKNCVGTTPFEADRVKVVDVEGEKRVVSFKDVEGDKESFYIVVSRPGYKPQAVEVPAWEHVVKLQPEGGMATPSDAAASTQTQSRAVMKITSEPVGALVYIGGTLKGNTPFSYEGQTGTVNVKLELAGHQTIEKALALDASVPLNLNFKMVPDGATANPARMPASKQESNNP